MSTCSVTVDSAHPLVDRSHLELLVGSNFEESRELLDDLISLFEEENGPHLQELRQTCESNDLDQTIRHIHFIAGSSGNMGLARLSKYCRALESAARDFSECPNAEQFEQVSELYTASIAAYNDVR